MARKDELRWEIVGWIREERRAWGELELLILEVILQGRWIDSFVVFHKGSTLFLSPLDL